MTKANRWGYDINKAVQANGEKIKVPESVGLVPAVAYLVCTILLQPIFTHVLGQYNAALLSICFTIFLGFLGLAASLRVLTRCR